MDQTVLKSLDNILGVLHRHAHGRLNSQHISKRTALSEKNLPFSRKLHHLCQCLFTGFMTLLILDHFYANHQTTASDIANDLILLFELFKFSQ